MSDAHFAERHRGIEKDKARMDKWNEPVIRDRMAILRDLIKTVNHILIYLGEINETLSALSSALPSSSHLSFRTE